jgi:hypothetical protein
VPVSVSVTGPPVASTQISESNTRSPPTGSVIRQRSAQFPPPTAMPSNSTFWPAVPLVNV